MTDDTQLLAMQPNYWLFSTPSIEFLEDQFWIKR